VIAAAPPHASLVASPAHIVLAPGDRRLVHVGATGGGQRVVVTATVAGFALDLRGRPKIARAGDAASWLVVAPRRLRLGRGGGVISIRSRSPAHATPGDHSALVLLTTSRTTARGVLVRMRIGLTVSVRIPGRLVHRLLIRRVRVRRQGVRRTLEISCANGGNVIEHVNGGVLRITLMKHGRPVGRWKPARRDLLPHSTGLFSFGVPRRLRGAVIARVELQRAGTHTVRRFRLRL